MATTVYLFDHTLTRFFTGANAAGDTYKVKLYEDDASFDAATTTLEDAELGATEVYGGGWPQGGFTLTGVTIAAHATSGVKFDADDVIQAVSGADLGPYEKYIIFNDTDTDDPPVAFFLRDSAALVEDGNSLGIVWSDDGIIAVELA